MRAWYGILLAGCFGWLIACGTHTPTPPDAALQTSPIPGVVSPFAVATSAPETPAPLFGLPTRQLPLTPEIASKASQPLTLTLWVPEEFAPGAERGGDVLETLVGEFRAAHPRIAFNFVLKAPYGKGGMVDWLTQLDELMPDRLPDAVIVDSRELDQLERLKLLHPLNRALPSGALWDMFAAGQAIARRNGTWNNQPLVLDTEHLVYDTRRGSPPPATWTQVLADKAQLAFAADSTEAFLFHYLENGGALDPSAHPALDASVMQSVLDYYQRARANGNLNENTAVLKSARDVMPLFVTGQTPMAQVRARDFLAEESRLTNAAAAPVPTRDGRATALTSAWSFVVITDEPDRQGAVVDWLLWLIEPAHMADWARAARLVPASKSAFAEAMDSPAYSDLMWKLLEDPLVAPSFAQQAAYAAAWHTAVQDVLDGKRSPDDAAFRAAQAITQ